MFEMFYGLRTDPFRLTPDHRFLFDHQHFSKAKAYIDYALMRGEGFVMITGKPGTGKTTLVADLQSRLPATEITTATINCTQLDAQALLLICAYEFGLQVESSHKAILLRELLAFFQREHGSGRRVLLVIDEAQDLSVQALEELRLLTNQQSAGRPLVQIILLGQSSLLKLIRRPDMQQVHQRIVAATHLQAFTPQETVDYVRYRLQTAGWTGDPVFRPGVLKAVYAYSQGIPRLINQICSRLLLRGFSLESHELTRDDAHQVLLELQEEGLIQPRRPNEATASPEPTPAIQWSVIDKGLYPQRPDAPAPTEHPVPPAPEKTPSPERNDPGSSIGDEVCIHAKVPATEPEQAHPLACAADTRPKRSQRMQIATITLIGLVLLAISFLAGMFITDDALRQRLTESVLNVLHQP